MGGLAALARELGRSAGELTEFLDLVALGTVADVVPLDRDHPLRVEESDDGTPRPYVFVRRGLEARIARAVFYEMVAIAEPDPAQPDMIGVWSAGQFFRLGRTV